MKIDPKCEVFLRRVGAKARAIRNEKGWTLEQMEEFGWPSWRHLREIEAGRNSTLASLWKLAKILKVDPADLLNP